MPRCYAGSDYGLIRLARAVILQAVRDAQAADPVGAEARAWLLGEDCAIYAEMVGLDHNAIRAWVLAGCIGPSRRNGRVKESCSHNGN